MPGNVVADRVMVTPPGTRSSSGAGTRPDSLILVTVDSLRFDALGCNGAPAVATPRMDGLAVEGVRFTQAIANGPRTQASFPSILCSLYPLVAGEREGLPRGATTVAEALRDAGFATAGFNPSNPFLTRETGYDRGFSHFVDFWDVHPRRGGGGERRGLRSLRGRVHDAVGRRSLGVLMLYQAAVQAEGGQYLTGETVVERGLAWARRCGGRFFLWLHLMDVHFPYHPLPGTRRFSDRVRWLLAMAAMAAGRPAHGLAELRTLYDRRVEHVDRVVGLLLDGMREAGLDERTMVVLGSDHGERFGEHGGFAHGPDVYEELLRVPLIVAGPGVAPGHRVDEQIGLIDLAPTLLNLLGVPVPPSFEGRSFVGMVRGEPVSGCPWVFCESMHAGGRASRVGEPDRFRLVACRSPQLKLIRDDEVLECELYDLAADPGERVNLAERDVETASALAELIVEHDLEIARESARFAGDREQGIASGDDEVRRRLAALGYL